MPSIGPFEADLLETGLREHLLRLGEQRQRVAARLVLEVPTVVAKNTRRSLASRPTMLLSTIHS